MTSPQLTQPQLGVTRNLKHRLHVATPVRKRRETKLRLQKTIPRVIRHLHSVITVYCLVAVTLVVAHERRARWMAERMSQVVGG